MILWREKWGWYFVMTISTWSDRKDICLNKQTGSDHALPHLTFHKVEGQYRANCQYDWWVAPERRLLSFTFLYLSELYFHNWRHKLWGPGCKGVAGKFLGTRCKCNPGTAHLREKKLELFEYIVNGRHIFTTGGAKVGFSNDWSSVVGETALCCTVENNHTSQDCLSCIKAFCACIIPWAK